MPVAARYYRIADITPGLPEGVSLRAVYDRSDLIHRAIATASGIGTLIAIPTTIGFAIIGFREGGLPWGSLGYINIPATIAIASMSMLTAPLGVAAAHSLPAGPLKKIFGVYLLIIGALMLRAGLKI